LGKIPKKYSKAVEYRIPIRYSNYIRRQQRRQGNEQMSNNEINNATIQDLPKMVAFLISKGWAVDETTTLEGAKQMLQFQSFLDGTL
jgi:hypothetical protein